MINYFGRQKYPIRVSVEAGQCSADSRQRKSDNESSHPLDTHPWVARDQRGFVYEGSYRVQFGVAWRSGYRRWRVRLSDWNIGAAGNHSQIGSLGTAENRFHLTGRRQIRRRKRFTDPFGMSWFGQSHAENLLVKKGNILLLLPSFVSMSIEWDDILCSLFCRTIWCRMETLMWREIFSRSYMPIVIPQAITAVRLTIVSALLIPGKFSSTFCVRKRFFLFLSARNSSKCLIYSRTRSGNWTRIHSHRRWLWGAINVPRSQRTAGKHRLVQRYDPIRNHRATFSTGTKANIWRFSFHRYNSSWTCKHQSHSLTAVMKHFKAIKWFEMENVVHNKV